MGVFVDGCVRGIVTDPSLEAAVVFDLSEKTGRRPRSAGVSYLAKRVDEKLWIYRNDPAARRALEQRAASARRQRPRSPGEFSFVDLNRDAICEKPEEWRELGVELGRRRPSSASTPGSGGSPTSRVEYLYLRDLARTEVEEHRAAVREKRDVRQVAWYRNKVVCCQRKHNKRRLVSSRGSCPQQRPVPLIWAADRFRRMVWNYMDFVDRCAVRQDVNTLISILTRRKTAAVRIATWYKAILSERRRQFLTVTCRRLHRFFADFFEMARAKTRQACAQRALDVMTRCATRSCVATAVQRLLHSTIVIQRSWRARQACRANQVAILILQLTQFEAKLLRHNRRRSPTRPLSSVVDDFALSLGGMGRSESIRRTGRGKKVKMDDEDDSLSPQQLMFLSTVTVRLAKSIKEKVVKERLVDELRRFDHRWEKYSGERKIFAKQKPIDDARLSLLRSAGIEADSNLEPPRRPRLRVLQSRSNLASMLETGLRHLAQRNAEAREGD